MGYSNRYERAVVRGVFVPETPTADIATRAVTRAYRDRFVDPKDTTKECASCGVATDKPLWVREHSCLARGFEMDRDANAVVRLRLTGSKREAFATAINIFSRSFEQL